MIDIECLADWGTQKEVLNNNQSFLCARPEDAERMLVV
jgi:hypothetical protein